jgi:hypothetical protein
MMTSDYHDLRERRIRQFTSFLEKMSKRRSNAGNRDCFIVFDERKQEPDLQDPSLSDSVTVEVPAEIAVLADAAYPADSLCEIIGNKSLGDTWRQDESSERFIQFAFLPACFRMDIPNSTLYRAEADIIVQRRLGFFYEAAKHLSELNSYLARFNPLNKVYIYGDERSAAEDMAYVWFDVWRFPADWRFFVKAGTFNVNTDWELGFPLDPT